MKCSVKSALFASLFVSMIMIAGPAEAKSTKQPAAEETTLEVKAKLDAFAKDYINRANMTLKPNRVNMDVSKQQGKFVARYLEVDPTTLTTEIYPSKAPGCAYVGHIVYLEKVYECTGDSKVTASKGDFKQIKARRIRELTRYDKKQGKWIY